MLSNFRRIWLYLATIIIAVIVIGVVFTISAQRKTADIRTLTQVRALSYALESFKQDYWRYPSARRIALTKDVALTENGFSQGDTVYFKGAIDSPRAVTYAGDDTTYSISFSLRNTWPKAGIEGKKCTVRENFVLSCPKT